MTITGTSGTFDTIRGFEKVFGPSLKQVLDPSSVASPQGVSRVRELASSSLVPGTYQATIGPMLSSRLASTSEG